MLSLPRALEPWRTILSLLPDDVALGLCPAILRLATALGPLRVRARSGDGEPDGFDGIARRGSYERLLLSEWVLADEAPLEFIRRAAVGEHAFLELCRRDPARSLVTMAVFETGPEQLGAPRLVQIAALMVLAQRAEAAGATFRWGFWHLPGHPMLGCQTAAHVAALASGRTRAGCRAEDVEAWRERGRAESSEEIWFVGSAAATSLAAREGAAALALEQVVHPTTRAVEVTVKPPSRHGSSVLLELPDERLCARVLRDPLDVIRPEPRGVPAQKRTMSNLVFAANGRKLFARASFGALVAVPVPNSPRAGTGQPKLYMPRTHHHPVAVGWHMRSAIVATFGNSKLELATIKGRASIDIEQCVEIPDDRFTVDLDASAPLAPIVFSRHGAKLVPLVPDSAGRVFELGSFFQSPVEPVAEGLKAVTCFGNRGGAIVLVARGIPADSAPRPSSGELPQRSLLLPQGSGFAIVALRVHQSERAPATIPLEGDGSFASFIGWSTSSEPHPGVVAVQQRGRSWTIYAGDARFELTPDEASLVVGVGVDAAGGAGAEPSLLVLDPDRRGLSFVGRRTSRKLPPSVERIVRVTVSHTDPMLAYVTESGRLVVLSTAADKPLLVHVPEGAP